MYNETNETMHVKIRDYGNSCHHSNDVIMLILEGFHHRIQVLEKHILESKTPDINTDTADTLKQVLSNIEFFNRSLNKFENKLDDLVEDNSSLNTRLEDAEESLSNLDARVDDLDCGLDDVKTVIVTTDDCRTVVVETLQDAINNI